jgi:uncharacterized membrane protein YhdT
MNSLIKLWNDVKCSPLYISTFIFVLSIVVSTLYDGLAHFLGYFLSYCFTSAILYGVVCFLMRSFKSRDIQDENQ